MRGFGPGRAMHFFASSSAVATRCLPLNDGFDQMIVPRWAVRTKLDHGLIAQPAINLAQVLTLATARAQRLETHC